MNADPESATSPKREGFWRRFYNETDPLPWPVAQPGSWEGETATLQQLARVEAQATVTSYRGFSQCRICGCRNGSGELSHDGWTWPGGLRHYIERHHVRPSTEFLTWLLGQDPVVAAEGPQPPLTLLPGVDLPEPDYLNTGLRRLAELWAEDGPGNDFEALSADLRLYLSRRELQRGFDWAVAAYGEA